MAQTYKVRRSEPQANGAVVGIRSYDDLPTADQPEISIVVFVTGPSGRYLNPFSMDGPPKSDDKRVISSRQLRSFIRKAAAISTELLKDY